MDKDLVGKIVKSGKLIWRKHAFTRMLERGISRQIVIDVLIDCDLIESYPDDSPFPSALFFCEIGGRQVHVVAALDATEEEVHVITVYQPDKRYFEKNGKTRKS